MNTLLFIQNELRKTKGRALYILSAIYIAYLILSSAFRIVFHRVLSASSIVHGESIDYSITTIATRWGLIIFCILIVVTWAKESKYKIYSKLLIAGYSRVDLLISTVFRNFLYSLLFTLYFCSVILLSTFNIFEGSHSNQIGSYILFVFAVYFFSSIIVSSIILYTDKIYLSIILLIFLVFTNQLFVISKQLINIDISVFHPFAILSIYLNAFSPDKLLFNMISISIYLLLSLYFLLLYFQKRKFN